MVRCSKCKKSFKTPQGHSWNFGICKKCYNKPNVVEYNKPEIKAKTMSNPFDMYLDEYTLKEMRNIDN